jgi:membrane fusion protein (multidrug efflux system)
MKSSTKYLLYIGVPLLCVGAVFLFNHFSGKDPINTMPGKGLSGGPAGPGARGGGPRVLPVSGYVVTYETGESGLTRLGTLVANEKVQVMSELSGRVTDVNFEEGQFIRKGTVLVKLNDDELLTQLTRAEYQYTLLEQRLQRQKILLEKDAVSQEDYDKVQTEFNVLKQDIEELKIRIGKMKIKAPFDGVIGFRQVSEGAFLQPGSKIADMVDVARLKLEFSIPEKYIASRLVGTQAEFTVEGVARTFQATIYAMDPQIDVATRTIMLRALYDNNVGLLRPGMSARVSIRTGSDQRSLFVPSQAVVPDVNGRYVWLNKGGKAFRSYVQTGNRTTDKLEITAGVEVGDTLITTGIMQLKDDMAVTITNL